MTINHLGYEPRGVPGTLRQTTLTVNATSGTYKLQMNGAEKTAAIAFDALASAVKSAIETAWPGVTATVTGGVGGADGGTPYVIITDKSPIDFDVTDSTLAGSGATAAAVVTQMGDDNTFQNRTVANPLDVDQVETSNMRARTSHPWSGSNPTYPFSL